MRRAVSEFPNDNPELHDGLVWSAPTPCAPALPTLRLRAPTGPAPRVMAPSWAPFEAAEPLLPEPVIWEPVIVESAIWEPECTEPVVELAAVESAADELLADEPVADAPAPVPPTPFEELVFMLARIALERGATRAAACVPGLFGLERPALEALDPATLEALRAGAIIERESSRPSGDFLRIASAWRDVLEGTAGDLARCGSTPLDAWAAGVLGALLPRERGDELRRELRKRGVAAFGLLAAA